MAAEKDPRVFVTIQGDVRDAAKALDDFHVEVLRLRRDMNHSTDTWSGLISAIVGCSRRSDR